MFSRIQNFKQFFNFLGSFSPALSLLFDFLCCLGFPDLSQLRNQNNCLRFNLNSPTILFRSPRVHAQVKLFVDCRSIGTYLELFV